MMLLMNSFFEAFDLFEVVSRSFATPLHNEDSVSFATPDPCIIPFF